MSAIRELSAGQLIEEHRWEQAIEPSGVGVLACESRSVLYTPPRQPTMLFAPCPPCVNSHEPLLGRMWELRRNFTAYIALAEALDATLYTCDEKLRRGHRARVVLFT